MTGFVLDCSVAMAWCFGDETNPYSEAVLQGLADNGAVAPSIWPLEMANVLLVAERRKRISKAQSRRFVELLQALPIAVDDVSAARAWDGVLSLAREQQLSAYDAAYLELAMREGLPLATLDGALRKAARSCGVALR
ncbi:MAG: type II toxin-antitoxin system VapC family toxin [Deltaproteobacteria bacterium]|nr:type II toxin-antitoxin system VapC family toxin [Deltaproteobacteria bacterium]